MDLIKNGGIVDGRWHCPGFTIGDLLHCSAQDLPGARLREACNGDRELEGGDRADLLADELDDFLLDVSVRSVHASFEHDEAARHFSFQFVLDADHRALGYIAV